MSKNKIKCYGHQCSEKTKCLLYTQERIEDDNEIGDNNIDCEMKENYADTNKVR